LRGHSERVNAVAFSRDGTRAFSCGRDRTVRVWDLASGATLAAFTADAALRTLALAADDSILAAGDMAGRIHFLRLIAM
ncbi:MAG TPA: WD40 repeat domain-containing protein, partial [Steroidobacteraceae bacterium]|nr:WD40 repeat domain-containing protein [Steroidobacteraceae bacterium]